MKKNILFAFSMFFILSSGYAQLETKSVSVFKNNKAFFIKSGSVATKDNVYQLQGDIPRALFGTLWFQSINNTLKLVSSTEENVAQQTFPINHYQILKANINKTVSIYLSPTEVVEGMVESFSKEYDEETKSYFPATFVILKIHKFSDVPITWQSIRIEDIKRIGFLQKPEPMVKSYEKKKVVNVEFTNGTSPQPLNLMYLEDGLGWSPNYLLELTSENKGILTLQAQVKNDAEDIKGADVSFVVGNANFKDANKLAWLVDFLPQVEVQNYNRSVYDNTMTNKSAEAEAKAPSSEGDGVEGEAAEDLFFYNLKNLTLLNGSRAQLELFRAEINFEHLYETRLNNIDAYSIENYVQTTYATEDKSPKTFHSLKMTNQTKYPWTAGLCFVVNKEKGTSKPISQDILSYTPIKGDNSLKLTESPDIMVSQTEKETSRKTAARKSKEMVYDLITVEAEIKIVNYKTKDVKMNVKRLLFGELSKSSVDWRHTEKLNYIGYLNKSNEVIWETNVKAGEEKIIKYSYTLLVRAI